MFTPEKPPSPAYNKAISKPAIPLRILTIKRITQNWDRGTGEFRESEYEDNAMLQFFDGREWTDVPNVVVTLVD